MQIINSHVFLVNGRQRELSELNPAYLRNYCFETFFLQKFVQLGYDQVKKWTSKRPDVFEMGRLIFPSKCIRICALIWNCYHEIVAFQII